MVIPVFYVSVESNDHKNTKVCFTTLAEPGSANVCVGVCMEFVGWKEAAYDT